MIFQCFSAAISKHLKEDRRYGLARLSAVIHIVAGFDRAVFAHLGADKNERLSSVFFPEGRILENRANIPARED